MRCRYCGYDVDVTQQVVIQGACGLCSVIADGLKKRTITSAAVKRILDDARPEEAWMATWGKRAAV